MIMAWQWNDLGTPAGQALELTFIAPVSCQGRPYVFVWGHNWHLWASWWDGQASHWEDHGAPHDQTLKPSPSPIATASYNNNPMAFVFGSDGHLWANWWDGQAWHWTDHGSPPGPDFLRMDEIATASRQDRPMVFTTTEDRQQTDVHLWVNWWDGSAWHWTEQDTPPGTDFPMNTIAAVSCQSRPYVFVWDNDSGSDSDPHPWVNWWSQ